MSDQPARGLSALLVGGSIWLRVLGRRWPTLIVGVAVYAGLLIGGDALWRAIPTPPNPFDWMLWILFGLSPHLVNAGLAVFAATQVLAVVEARDGGLRAAVEVLRRRLGLIVLLGLISALLVMPIRAFIVILSMDASRVEVAEWSALLYLLMMPVALAVNLFTEMATPAAVDRDLKALPALREGAGLALRRWGVLLFAGLALLTLSVGLGALTPLVIFDALPMDQMSRDDIRLVRTIGDIPSRVVSLLTLLYWPAVYVALRPPRA